MLINDVIYAEIIDAVSNVSSVSMRPLAAAGVTVVTMPRIALFLAGKTFLRYRDAAAPRPGVLPDFFIGAHAAVERLPLLTRDARRYRHYFPTVELIAPDGLRL